MSKRKNNIIEFKIDKKQPEGIYQHFGISIDNVEPGNLWASHAEELGLALQKCSGYNVEAVNSNIYDEEHDCAEFEFFARYDTVYILSYNGIPVTLHRVIDERFTER